MNSPSAMNSPVCRPQGVYTTLEDLLALQHKISATKSSENLPSKHILLGNTRSRRRGSGIEFEEVRAYAPGDEIRNISWRLSARTGKPLTKLYTQEREKPVYIMLDQRSPMFFGSGATFKSVTAAYIASICSWLAYREGQRLGGSVLAEQIYPIKIMHARQSLPKLLALLVAINNSLSAKSCVKQTLSHAVAECTRRLPAGSRIVLISDFHDFDDVCHTALASLGKQHDLQLVKVSDSLEQNMRVQGAVGMSDGQKRERLFINKQIRNRYQQHKALQHERLQSCAMQSACTLLSLNEQDPLSAELFEFPAHGLRR